MTGFIVALSAAILMTACLLLGAHMLPWEQYVWIWTTVIWAFVALTKERKIERLTGGTR